MSNLSDQSSPQFFVPARRSLMRSLRIRVNGFVYRNKVYKDYISMDSFARLADYHVYGKSGMEPINRRKSEVSQVIFINSDKFKQIDFKCFPNLKVILSGNTDTNLEEMPDLPPNVKQLLMQNCTVSSEKIKNLPIGLENKSLGRFSNLKHLSTKVSQANFTSKILVPPMSDTNSTRSLLISECLKSPEIYDVKNNYLYEKDYFKLLNKYQFLLCVEGNGFDTHRIWEALYLGIFPIVLKTNWSSSLDYLKLPILLVDDLSKVTSDDLYRFWSSNSTFDPKSTPQLWLEYWKKMIQATVNQA